MEPGRFFYSINGTDVYGPVTDGDLRQLWLDNRIGPDSFLCRAGELTWSPCDPTDYPPRPARVRRMVIVPSQMYATLLAAEHSPLATEVASSSVESLASNDLAFSKRVTIRLTSPPELLAKAPEVSRSRSLRGALIPRAVPARPSVHDGAPLRARAATPPPVPVPQPTPSSMEAGAADSPKPEPIAPPRIPELASPSALVPVAQPPPLPIVAKAPLATPPLEAPAPEPMALPLSAVIAPSPSVAAMLSSSPPRMAEPVATPPVVAVSPVRIPPLPPALPAKPFPVEAGSARVFEEETSDEEKPAGLGDFGVVLYFLAGLAAVGAAFLSAFLSHPPPGNPVYVFGYRCGAFLVTFLAVVLVPWLISRLTRGDLRVITRAGGMMVLAVLISVLYLIQPEYKPAAEARAITEQQKQEAQQEIATKGYYTGNNDQAEQNIENLKSQLTDNSERSRVGRAILTVTAELLAKVRASDAVEKTCKFTLEGVTSADDLAARSQAITRLHAAQNDVIAFLQNYDQHCREALASDNIAAETRDEVTASARKGAHVDLLVTLWQEKMKLSDDYVARFDFLRKNWGGWQLRNGEVIFQDDTLGAAYDALVQAVQADIDKIHDTQKQIFR